MDLVKSWYVESIFDGAEKLHISFQKILNSCLPSSQDVKYETWGQFVQVEIPAVLLTEEYNHVTVRLPFLISLKR